MFLVVMNNYWYRYNLCKKITPSIGWVWGVDVPSSPFQNTPVGPGASVSLVPWLIRHCVQRTTTHTHVAVLFTGSNISFDPSMHVAIERYDQHVRVGLFQRLCHVSPTDVKRSQRTPLLNALLMICCDEVHLGGHARTTHSA